ncbi:MAG: hypothetical protein IPM25_12365 [Chloracidobacterium sp.]|nr:hypothetical protein [Chloracidobacterium sp.]
MSDEPRSAGDTGLGYAAAGEPVLDEHTTEPNAAQPDLPAEPPAAPGKWQMPKPKFQQSSGYLPQGYLKEVEAAAAAAKGPPGSEDTTQEQAPFVPAPIEDPATPAAIDIEPQPDISEQLLPEESLEQAAKAETSVKKGSSIVPVILGLLGIILFIAAFIAIVYFLFFARPVDTQLG